MGVRVSERFLNSGVSHPAAHLAHTGEKHGSGLKLAADPD